MNYEFCFNSKNRHFSCEVEGELVALGDFLTTETALVQEPLNFVKTLMENIQSNTSQEMRFTEWLIKTDNEDIECFHNILLSTAELEGELGDWNHFAQCGKEDLLELLSAWYLFIKTEMEN